MSELLLITGKKGHGKTLWTVEEAFKQYDQGKFENYYADITGLRHKGFEPVVDWRDCKDNSLIILDEVQFNKSFNRAGNKFDMQIVELTTMRKRGITIWLITQRARLLNADVLALVDRHIHIERNGQKTSRVYEFSDAEMNITKTKKLFAADKYIYTHNPEIYAFYESIKEGAKHYKKSWFNKGAVSTIITMVIVFLFGGYFIYNGWSNGMTVSGGQVEGLKEDAKKNNQNGNNQFGNAPTQKPVSEVSPVAPLSPTDLTFCTQSYGWTVEQCNKYYRPAPTQTNVENGFNQQASFGSSGAVQIKYDPNNPYDVEIDNYPTATAFPKFSGCAKFNGVYYGYTQQGTKLKVKASDCKRLIENGDRPFDYYKQPEPMKVQEQPSFENKQQPVYLNVVQSEKESVLEQPTT